MSTSRPNDDALSSLPPEVREEGIYIPSPLCVLGLLARTSQQYEAETAFVRLLAASIHAAPASWDDKEDATALAAIALLKRHPELLFREKKITDHYSREIWASPYKIFLGTGDIWALRQIKKDILPLIANGETQEEAQFKEQFPNCPWPPPKNFSEEMLYDDRNKRQIKEIVEQLAIVKQCIDVDPFNNNKPHDATQQAVETLCKLFQPTPKEVIQSGLHFPPGIIQEIYKTYNALQNHWSFFELAIIKPALDALSTVDGQCCQGSLNELDMEKGPNRRCHPSFQHPLGKPLSLRLVNDKDKREATIVDPCDGDVLFLSSSDRGSIKCVNKQGAVHDANQYIPAASIRWWILGGGQGRDVAWRCWRAYREHKQELMEAIMRPSTAKSTHYLGHHNHSMRCVIL